MIKLQCINGLWFAVDSNDALAMELAGLDSCVGYISFQGVASHMQRLASIACGIAKLPIKWLNMPKLTKVEMAEKLASEVEDYDLKTLIECARNHEREYWLKQSKTELKRIYNERFEINKE